MGNKLLSEWAYNFCKIAKEDYNIINLEKKKQITDSFWAYMYCRNIVDDKDVRKHITDTLDIRMYLTYIDSGNVQMKNKLNTLIKE